MIDVLGTTTRRGAGFSMTVQVWGDLSERQKRRALTGTGLTVLAAWLLLFGAYALVPFRTEGRHAALLRLITAIVLFLAVFVWQIKHIVQDALPGLRAARALGVLLPLFLVSFSAVYLSLAGSSESNFNQPLNHVSAFYFTVTVFSSVGFGDITPRGSTAQLVVSTQMILDLMIVATVARVVIFAAKTGRSRKQSSPAPSNG
jgi:voltage-gated potassium channel